MSPLLLPCMIERAEHLADLLKYEEAWAAVEALPPEQRTTPAALRVRLRCCCGLTRWDLGKEIASVLEAGDWDDRIIVAAFYHALAIAQLQDGDREEARESAKKAIAAWEVSRLTMLEDRRLEGLW